MVEYLSPTLDEIFQALANPTRRTILATLSRKQATVLEIAGQFDLSLNGVSKHLKVLEQAGLISREIRGRTHYCSLQAGPLRQADAWLEYYRPYWEDRLDALDRFIGENRKKDDA